MNILGYGLRALLGRGSPYLFCLAVTDRCNLDCFYCQATDLGQGHMTWDQATGALDAAHARGHRFLVISGGEPTIWRDGDKRLPDLVRHAQDLGFLGIMVTTNGIKPLNLDQCMYLVTVDGPREVHDALRQGTYDRILINVRASRSRSVHASITLSRVNAHCLEQYVRGLAALGCFQSISFNFLTGRPEVLAEHGLSLAEKQAALDLLWSLKREDLPVLLSRAAYKALRANSWQRPIPQIELAFKDRVFPCCRDVDHPEICAQCGYSTCAEVSQMLARKPSAIIQAWSMLNPRKAS